MGFAVLEGGGCVDEDVGGVGADAVGGGGSVGAHGEVPEVFDAGDVEVFADADSAVGGGSGADGADAGDGDFDALGGAVVPAGDDPTSSRSAGSSRGSGVATGQTRETRETWQARNGSPRGSGVAARETRKTREAGQAGDGAAGGSRGSGVTTGQTRETRDRAGSAGESGEFDVQVGFAVFEGGGCVDEDVGGVGADAVGGGGSVGAHGEVPEVFDAGDVEVFADADSAVGGGSGADGADAGDGDLDALGGAVVPARDDPTSARSAGSSRGSGVTTGQARETRDRAGAAGDESADDVRQAPQQTARVRAGSSRGSWVTTRETRKTRQARDGSAGGSGGSGVATGQTRETRETWQARNGSPRGSGVAARETRKTREAGQAGDGAAGGSRGSGVTTGQTRETRDRAGSAGESGEFDVQVGFAVFEGGGCVDEDVGGVGADAVGGGGSVGAHGEVPEVFDAGDVEVFADADSAVGGGSGADGADAGDGDLDALGGAVVPARDDPTSARSAGSSRGSGVTTGQARETRDRAGAAGDESADDVRQAPQQTARVRAGSSRGSWVTTRETRKTRQARDGSAGGSGGSGVATGQTRETRETWQARNGSPRGSGVTARETRKTRKAGQAGDGAAGGSRGSGVTRGPGRSRDRAGSAGESGEFDVQVGFAVFEGGGCVDEDVGGVGADAVGGGGSVGAHGEVPEVFDAGDVEVFADADSAVGGGSGADGADAGDGDFDALGGAVVPARDDPTSARSTRGSGVTTRQTRKAGQARNGSTRSREAREAG
ncbi:hypothetical protein [Arthrobacter woluwensis]|uniref:hypothetical protein n=1 Tax=Arthrobacter woluwensis TaxID=156980 RepID=UPI001AAF7E42|nr:hypothetical protein [Arthrobacter woluwensis]QTF70570.1 hypothetical protein G8758_11860 [Arthrobacter woluwensis]